MLRNATILMLLCAVAFACSKDRATVKQMKDAAAAKIDIAHPKQTSIAELNALPRPADDLLKRSQAERVDATEQQAYTLEAVVEKAQVEKDGDAKLFLVDPSDPSKRMLAEVPEAECVAPAFRKQLARVRNAVKKSDLGNNAGLKVRITGVGYWGFVRANETSANGIQVHPVLSLTIVK